MMPRDLVKVDSEVKLSIVKPKVIQTYERPYRMRRWAGKYDSC